jgi:2',3'-cyclic-nucleotide 2'-phosphodiesterase (5'-nucleotidase family)
MGLISNGLDIIDIMNKIGYDVVTLGNHDFDYGIDRLKDCAKRLDSGYISVNYCFRINKTAIYPTYKIIEKGNKKIAFIGVTTPETLTKTSLITLKDENGQIIYDFLNENHNKELFEKVQQTIDKVKNEGADYVIIVAHLGIGGNIEEENTSTYLLKNLRNVNALIDGHTHLLYNQTTPDKSGKKIPFAQAGTKLNNIGVFIIHTDDTITHENISSVPFDEVLEQESLKVTRGGKEIYVDKEMNQYINDKFDSFSDILNQIIGKTDFNLNIYELGSTDRQPSKQLSRINENILCNLITDSMRYFGEADISIMNAGTIRADIDQGDITYQEVINTMPYSNDVIVKEITGQTILDALEFGVRFLPEQSSNFPQVSGITYKIDTSINSGVITDNNDAFMRVGGKRRVYNVKINGEQLDLLKTYTIASNSFILEGGDGYSMFADAKITKTAVGVDNEILLKYIQDTLSGVVPEKYKETEGRITITNGRESMLTSEGFMMKSSYISIIGFLLLLF